MTDNGYYVNKIPKGGVFGLELVNFGQGYTVQPVDTDLPVTLPGPVIDERQL